MDSCTSIYPTKFEKMPVILKCKSCNFNRTFFSCENLHSTKGIEWYFDTGIVVFQYKSKLSAIYTVELLLKYCRFQKFGVSCLVVMRRDPFVILCDDATTPSMIIEVNECSVLMRRDSFLSLFAVMHSALYDHRSKLMFFIYVASHVMSTKFSWPGLWRS